jgi:Cu/Ag efflux protein CusF
MKRRQLLGLLACWIPAAFAADHPPPKVAPAVEYHGVAMVNRVEPVMGLLNLSHGAVPAVGWQPMTHDLWVKPPKLTSGLRPGMMIKFQLTATGPMSYVITALEPVQP